MKIDAKQLKRVDLLKVSGRLDSSSDFRLQQTMKEIMDNGRFRIVLDFSDLQFISSGGIRVLIAGVRAARRWNRGDIRLAALSPYVKKTFEMAGLMPIFQIFDTDVEAVASF